MESLISEAWVSLDLLLRQPGSSTERWLALGLGFFAMVWAQRKVGSAVEIPNIGPLLSFSVAIVGVAVVLAAMWLSRQFLLPHVVGVSPNFFIVASGLGISLLIVPLLNCVLQKATFLGTFMAWGSGLAAAALVVLATTTLFAGVEGGAEKMGETKSRTEEVNRFLEQH